MTYPGGKGSLYQKLINMIPPHRVYIETHAGSGAVLRQKRAARLNIALDIDPQAVAQLRYLIAKNGDAPGTTIKNGEAAAKTYLVNADAVAWLRGYRFSGDEFLYADPPYLMHTRKQQRDLYRFEYTTAQHVDLLTILTALPCSVMVSGYRSDLYEKMLAGWRVETFEVITRGGSWATEYVWMNYPAPTRLHDYRYLGNDYRERERIKRKKSRWVNRLTRMDLLERRAVLSAIDEVF